LVGNLCFKDHQDEIMHWFRRFNFKNTLELNTSELSTEECLKIIINKMEDL